MEFHLGPDGEVGRVLVLTRRLGEGIMIGDDIEITVLSTEGSKVRLGIQAPSGVTILRSELAAKGAARPDAERPTVSPASAP